MRRVLSRRVCAGLVLSLFLPLMLVCAMPEQERGSTSQRPGDVNVMRDRLREIVNTEGDNEFWEKLLILARDALGFRITLKFAGRVPLGAGHGLLSDSKSPYQWWIEEPNGQIARVEGAKFARVIAKGAMSADLHVFEEDPEAVLLTATEDHIYLFDSSSDSGTFSVLRRKPVNEKGGGKLP